MHVAIFPLCSITFLYIAIFTHPQILLKQCRIIHRNITQEICGCNIQDKFSRANPVALLLREISLGSSGNLHRFWTRRAP